MKLDDVRKGMLLKADGGFRCIARGAVLTVELDDKGYPFVPCRNGGHWLGGCVGADRELIGFEMVPVTKMTSKDIASCQLSKHIF